MLRSFLSHFVFPILDNKEDAPRVGLLHFLIVLHILIALCVSVFFSFIAREPSIYAVLALLSILPTLGSQILLFRGHHRLASAIFVSMIAVLMPIIAWFSHNSSANVIYTAFQAVTVVMAGVLLGGRGVFVFVLFTIIANVFLLCAESVGLYSVENDFNRQTILFSQFLTFSEIAVILWLANWLIRESFQRAKREAQERQIAEHGLQLAMQAAKLEAWRYDIRANKVHASPHLLEMSGGEENLLNLGFIHPEDREMAGDTLQEMIAGGRESASITHRIICSDGTLRWVESWAMLERDEKSQPSMISGLLMDITERKLLEEQTYQMNIELERRVAERTAELESSNKELEAFSYSVSHDLRAPLRAIDGYSRILLEDYLSQFDAQGVDCLNNVRLATHHMNNLIDDLLKLSGISRAELNWTRVDLSELAQEVLASLQQNQPTRCVEVKIQPGLYAEGDPNLLRIMLENLLGNAWKFTRLQPNACIEFGAFDQQGQKVFFVRDNGIGFDMAYADKLFLVFQRLHRPEEFEGTGIGLATVQRIIQRHRGRIWAESEVNKGAVFFFTLGA